MMKRREFITLLAGTAVAWPLAARAQQAERVRRIGLLMTQAEDDPEGQTRLLALAAKRLEVLRELVPAVRNVGLLTNPANPNVEIAVPDQHATAGALGLQLVVGYASSQSDIDLAFERFVRDRVQALLIDPDAVFFSRLQQITALAARHSIPTMYVSGQFAEAGGLMSYGANVADAYREVGVYAGKILKGVHPSDLPVLQPTKFELVINLKTAKSLGLTVPQTLLVAADEVIE